MLTADLHTHTRYSDGTDTLPELFAAAQSAGLTTVGLTDHDTAAGWDDAAEYAPAGLRVLPGAEFSTKHPRPDGSLVSVHLLGYLFDRDHPAIVAEWQRIVDERTSRGARMVQSLMDAGYPITLEQVQAVAGRENIGRPHIARALIDAGVVDTVADAFDGLIEDGAPHHVTLRSTSLVEGITMITEAGGVPIIAHPRARTAATLLTAPVLAALADIGLAGIEVRHPDHDDAARAELAYLADEIGLLQTGSSDYHGDNKTLRIGQERTRDDVVDEIIERGAVAPING